MFSLPTRSFPIRSSLWAPLLLACLVCSSTAGAEAEKEASPEDNGWDETSLTKMVGGCVESFTERLLRVVREQAELAEDAPLPEEFEAELDRMKEPIEATCRCVTERLAKRHTARELTKDPSPAIREAQAVGTPGGCTLDVD